MDSCSSSRIEVVDEMISNHFVAYRSHPRYKNSWPQTFIESQMSYLEADRVARKIIMQPRFQPVAVESRDPKGLDRFGVPTGKHEKILYCDRLYQALVNDKLHFAPDLICPHSSKQRFGPDVDALKENLRKQLGNFRKEIEVPNNPETGTYRVHYTGKAGGLKDDLVMALGMLLYWAQLKQSTDKEFRRICVEKGFVF
jgi:hypothetical protein